MKKNQRKQSPFPYQRPVKIRKSFYQCPFTSDRTTGGVRLLVKVPSIYLEGDWLKQAGFRCNTEVTVTVSQGCLTIQPKTAE